MKKYAFTILNFEFNRTTKNSFKIHFDSKNSLSLAFRIKFCKILLLIPKIFLSLSKSSK